MRVIKNQTMINRLSETVVANEMSNIAMVLQTPTILTTWYRIEPNMSELVPGWDNVDSFIASDSPIVFDKIENLPMYGVDNLIPTTEFDDEVGYDEDFSSSGVVYPNTIFPKPNDCFTINNAKVPGLYYVTDVKPVTVRSNPFIEIQFRLKTRDPNKIAQLERQVHEVYTTAMSPLGSNRSLIITKDAIGDIESHVKSYLDICHLYTLLFYDENKAAFVFDGLPDKEGRKACFIDMTLWKFMFDEGIIIYDELVTYANNNFAKSVDRIYTGCPDVYLDEHSFHRSIIWRVYSKEYGPTIKLNKFDEYRYPYMYHPTERITKYQGPNIWYLETYLNHPMKDISHGQFYIWDDEFLCRIRNNDPYPELPLKGGPCDACELHCSGAPVLCYNPYLRNAIIKWFNDGEIDWDNLQVTDDRTIENYYLIPIVLGIYKKFIQGLG